MFGVEKGVASMMASLPKTRILITGGTGFLGKAVLSRIAELSTYEKIYLLVRPKRDEDAKARVAKMIERMFPPGKIEALKSKILAVEGDLTAGQLGIPDTMITKLAADIDQILHVGASTDFGAPLRESRQNNVEGTRHVLDMAVKLKLAGSKARIDYISTAFVAGIKPGKVTEKDLDRNQNFANNYERSKCEAELLVRSYMDRLDIAIHRPSIVVGDSNNGYTPHFKVLYWPLLLLSKGLLPFIACNPRALLDVVPVNYVADGIVALMQLEQAIGNTYYLSAGLGKELRVNNFLRDAYELAGIKKVPAVPMWVFRSIQNTPLSRFFPNTFWEAVALAKPYDHYLLGTGVRFDASKSQAVLKSLGVTPPTWDDYKREVLTYCHASRWGKKIPMPEYIYYLPVSKRKEARHEFTHRQEAGGIAATV